MNTEFGPDYFAFNAIPLRHTFYKTTLIIQQCSRIAIQKLVLSTAWPGIVGGLFGFHVRRLHNIWQCWRWSVRGYLQYTYSSISSDFHQQGSRYLRNEKEASLPQGLHHSKRGQLLQETSACKYSIENQGIPWMQHCPILGRIHFTWFLSCMSGFLPFSALSHCWKTFIPSASCLTMPESIFLSTATVSVSLQLRKMVDFLRRTIRKTSVIFNDVQSLFLKNAMISAQTRLLARRLGRRFRNNFLSTNQILSGIYHIR